MLCQLRHREQTDTDLLAHALVANLDDTVLRQGVLHPQGPRVGAARHAKTDAAWVQTFVRTHADRSSGLSRREALKHL